MPGYDYDDYVTNVALMLVIPPTDSNYLQILPNIINDAEQRMYRELDLLDTVMRNTAGFLTPGNRFFQFPTHFVVGEDINIFTNVGSNPPTGRQPLIPVSREWMDWVYPDDVASTCSSCGDQIPHYYAMLTDQTILVGPSPAYAFQVEVVGTIRPTPLSASNETTYLTTYLPDLFFAASMVFGFAYIQDFGQAGADNPQSAATWESHYQALFQSANVEENRKKYASQAWTPKQPAPLATPPRM